MAVDDRLLGSGWYQLESSGEGEWVWSSDLAELDTSCCDHIHLKFFTTYPQFTGSPQRVSVLADGEV